MQRGKQNILAVGAHPDDIELGCGGTISKHVNLGDNVYALVITNGEKGRHDPDRLECFNSLESLAIPKSNIIFGNFPDGEVIFNQTLVDFIEKNISKFNIQKIYTHSSHDRHQDHKNVSLAVSAAARKSPSLLLYQTPSTTVGFEPHYFVGISDEILKLKLNALGCYKTQIEKGIVRLDYLRSLANVNGSMINADFAEAFELNHLYLGEDDV